MEGPEDGAVGHARRAWEGVGIRIEEPSGARPRQTCIGMDGGENREDLRPGAVSGFERAGLPRFFARKPLVKARDRIGARGQEAPGLGVEQEDEPEQRRDEAAVEGGALFLEGAFARREKPSRELVFRAAHVGPPPTFSLFPPRGVALLSVRGHPPRLTEAREDGERGSPGA